MAPPNAPIGMERLKTLGTGRLAGRSAYVSIRQHTSAYVSIRQHTSAYVSIRQHTSAPATLAPLVRGREIEAAALLTLLLTLLLALLVSGRDARAAGARTRDRCGGTANFTIT